MRGLGLVGPGEQLRVLCIGAHSDDIEIGTGATILDWIAQGVALEAHWAVLSAIGPRADEAKSSAADFLAGAKSAKVDLAEFRDGFFPWAGADIKAWMEDLKLRCEPDLVLCHTRDDAHQDHREVSKLVWNTFRDHTILEYEIPKWDGDLSRPNVYVPVSSASADRKIELLMRHFRSQRSKDWFDERTFAGLMRLRGLECRAPGGMAEAFHGRKLVIGPHSRGTT